MEHKSILIASPGTESWWRVQEGKRGRVCWEMAHCGDLFCPCNFALNQPATSSTRNNGFTTKLSTNWVSERDWSVWMSSSLTAPVVHYSTLVHPRTREQRWGCQSKGEVQEPLQGELGVYESSETSQTLNNPHWCTPPPRCWRIVWVFKESSYCIFIHHWNAIREFNYCTLSVFICFF